MPHVEIFTDGACKGNPGIGGWGALLQYGSHQKKLYGGERMSTNNRMELKAAIEALRALKRPCQVIVYTDSNYLKDGICQWLPQWQAQSWRKADGKPVKNQELWQDLVQACAPHQIEWRWLKGHAGHLGNEIADQLANEGIKALQMRQEEEHES